MDSEGSPRYRPSTLCGSRVSSQTGRGGRGAGIKIPGRAVEEKRRRFQA